jgi:hypothetical protein
MSFAPRRILIAAILVIALAAGVALFRHAPKPAAPQPQESAREAEEPAASAPSAAGEPALAPSPDPARAILPVAGGTAPAQVPARARERELFGSAWETSPRAELSAFAEWAREYLATSLEARPGLVARGAALARARRPVMLELIKTNPREAIASTVPLRVRAQLPAEVGRELEERVSGQGDIFRVMGLPQPGVEEPVPTVDQAKVGGRYFTAHRYGERALTPTLRGVSIHGVALDEHLAVSGSPVRMLEAGEAPPAETAEVCIVTDDRPVLPPGEPEPVRTVAVVGTHGYEMCCPFCAEDFDTRMARLEMRALSAPAALGAINEGQPRELSTSGVSGTADYPGKPPASLTHGAKKILFLRVDFSDVAYPAWMSEAYLLDQVQGGEGLNNRMKRISFDKTWIDQTDVTPVLRMPKPSKDYWKNADGSVNMNLYWGPISDDARAAARALGFEPNNYTCGVIVHEGFVQTGAAGWGGGDTIWCNGSADKKLLVHEYGHVFWLPHANSWTATDGNPLSPGRAHVEYGDASDPMGNAWGTGFNSDYNAFYKALCGWLPDAAVLPVSHSGTYRVHQFDGAADLTKPLALKITRDNELDLWVMFRGDGVPQGLYNAGAYVIAVPPSRAGDSHVLDLNDTSGNTDNAPLAQAQTWSDAVSGISLITAGRMATGSQRHLYVRVNLSGTYTQGHRALVSGGIYAFRNKSFNKYLDVPNNSAVEGTPPQLFEFNGSAAQQWVVWRNADGSYSFNHFGTNQWLDVSNNGGGNYNEIVQWTRNTSDAQKWNILTAPDGFLKLRHRGTNQVLSADTANNGDIIQYDDFTGEEQKWEPRLIGISEGTYRLVPRHAQMLALGLRGRSRAAGTQIEQQTWAGDATQRWTVQTVGGGQFRIFPQGTPSVTLAVAAGGMGDGAKAVLEPYTGAAWQKFTFTATEQGWVRITPAHATAKGLDVLGVSTAPGADLTHWHYVGGQNQQWRFNDADL